MSHTPLFIKPNWSLKPFGESITCFEWIMNNDLEKKPMLVAGLANGDMVLLDTTTFVVKQVIQGAHENGVVSIVSCSGTGLIASAGEDESIKLWKQEEDCFSLVDVHHLGDWCWISAMNWLPEDKALYASVSKSVHKFQIEDERLTAKGKSSNLKSTICSLDWSCDNTALLTSSYSQVSVFNKDLQIVSNFGHKGSFTNAQFSRSGKYIAGAMQEPSVIVFNTRERVAIPIDVAAKPSFIAWGDMNESLVIVASDIVSVIKDMEVFEKTMLDDNEDEDDDCDLEIEEFKHPGPITAASFRPKSTLFTSACEKGLLKITDIPSQVCLACFIAGKPISCLSWSPDGKNMAVGCTNGQILVFMFV